jgi:heptosyltransferase-2
MELSEPDSILVILPTWVGDCVMATPALRTLRARFPHSRIAHLIEPNLRDLVRGCPFADEIIEWPPRNRRRPWSRPFWKLVNRIRHQEFNRAVLFPNSFRSALLVALAGVPERVGYHRDARGWLLTRRIPVQNCGPRDKSQSWTNNAQREIYPQIIHGDDAEAMSGIIDRSGGRYRPVPLVDYYADLVEALGCPRPDDRLELFTTPEDDVAMTSRLGLRTDSDRPPLIVISPGAKFGMAKCWPTAKFAALADRMIAEFGARVLITCGPGEEPIAHAIRAAMRQPANVLDDPLLTLGQLKSLICHADLLVGNDAGPRHIAKAFQIPVVTIFGPTHPWWTATRYPRERLVRLDVECGPCQQRTCPLGHHHCMTRLEVDSVFTAVRELLFHAFGGLATANIGELPFSRRPSIETASHPETA